MTLTATAPEGAEISWENYNSAIDLTDNGDGTATISANKAIGDGAVIVEGYMGDELINQVRIPVTAGPGAAFANMDSTWRLPTGSDQNIQAYATPNGEVSVAVAEGSESVISVTEGQEAGVYVLRALSAGTGTLVATATIDGVTYTSTQDVTVEEE